MFSQISAKEGLGTIPKIITFGIYYELEDNVDDEKLQRICDVVDGIVSLLTRGGQSLSQDNSQDRVREFVDNESLSHISEVNESMSLPENKRDACR